MQFVCLISHPPISVNIPGGGIHEMGGGVGGASRYYTFFTKQECATQTFVFKMQVQRLTHLHWFRLIHDLWAILCLFFDPNKFSLIFHSSYISQKNMCSPSMLKLPISGEQLRLLFRFPPWLCFTDNFEIWEYSLVRYQPNNEHQHQNLSHE